MTHVKVCGITRVEDALAALQAGADALGLNFYQRSPRCVSQAEAKAIVEAVEGRALMVGVFVDEDPAEIARLKDLVGFQCVQFHGDEDPKMVERFLPHAYKAIRVRGSGVVELVQRYPGEHILLDAYVPGQEGGTGATFDWKFAQQVASLRKTTLAGGLTPDNVRNAIRMVRPFCVDVASGVESAPGLKDPALMDRFVQQVRGALDVP